MCIFLEFLCQFYYYCLPSQLFGLFPTTFAVVDAILAPVRLFTGAGEWDLLRPRPAVFFASGLGTSRYPGGGSFSLRFHFSSGSSRISISNTSPLIKWATVGFQADSDIRTLVFCPPIFTTVLNIIRSAGISSNSSGKTFCAK